MTALFWPPVSEQTCEICGSPKATAYFASKFYPEFGDSAVPYVFRCDEHAGKKTMKTVHSWRGNPK